MAKSQRPVVMDKLSSSDYTLITLIIIKFPMISEVLK
jgi:hypothetical protein